MYDWMTTAFLLMYDPLSQAVAAAAIVIVSGVAAPWSTLLWVW